jgi:uncharacterized protein (DUF2141 family)
VTLVASIQTVRSARGKVACLLFDRPEGFPNRRELALRAQTRPAASGLQRCVFSGLPMGTYAITVLHDENDNGKLDKGLFGPTEGWGVSRDARPMLRAPTFDECKVVVDANKTLVVTLRY